MRNLSNIGRVFYGLAIAGLGFLTIYAKDFPYMLISQEHSWIPTLAMFTYIFGTMLLLAGACIALGKWTRPISLLSGTVLLLIFCFYFIPYQLIYNPNYMHWGEWENAEKELALAAGAFVIAGCLSGKDENPLIGCLTRLIPLGTILFCITIMCFGIDHFLYAKDAADYVPSWIPNHIFWLYFTGVALTGSSLAIILKIKPALMAFLLGSMIFTWVIILHIPKVISAHFDDAGGEVTSAFLALGYCGIAYVISGSAKEKQLTG